MKMFKYIDDMAGAIFDIFKYICYFFAGAIIVGAPLYLIAKLFEWLF